LQFGKRSRTRRPAPGRGARSETEGAPGDARCFDCRRRSRHGRSTRCRSRPVQRRTPAQRRRCV